MAEMETKRKSFILTVLGEDKPGIVAGITKILYEEGFNIENSSMVRLNNEFSMILVITTDKDISTEKLKEKFKTVERNLGLTVVVKELNNIEEPENQNVEIYRIIIYGGDKPGIVYRITDYLAKNNINIIDLRTEKTKDIYVLIAEMEVPKNISEKEMELNLNSIADELKVDFSLEKEEKLEL